jgi:hypothetical protein
MFKKIINEGLDYMDLMGQLEPMVSVDEYSAKMGKDSDIVTIAFIVNSEAAGNDLVDWFERGYSYVLDASLSDGELSPGKHLVFVEMDRRSKVPERICELLSDLKTLTNLSLDEWIVQIDEEEHRADPTILKQHIAISPHEYREQEEQEETGDGELNEMREIAGLPHKEIHKKSIDADLQAFLNIAGL